MVKHFHYEEQMPGSYKIGIGGDEHYGNVDNDSVTCSGFIQWLKAGKNRFGTNGGDWVECIAPDDRRYDPKVHEGEGRFAGITKQKQYVIEKYQSVAHQMLYALMGNHELKEHKRGHFVTQEICKALGIDYGTYTAIVSFGAFRMFDWHGWGSVNSKLEDYKKRMEAERRGVMRKLHGQDSTCDVMVMHHIHKMRILPPELDRVTIDNNCRIKFKELPFKRRYIDEDTYTVPVKGRWYVSGGAALKPRGEEHTNYVEAAGYFPDPLGFLVIEVKNGKLVDITKKEF